MTVRAVAPDAQTTGMLAGTHFADAFRITIGTSELTARQAAERMFRDPPRWINGLMWLRNRIVAPLGLATPERHAPDAANRIGIFPVLSDAPGRLVAGFDDSHLDFRVIVDVAREGAVCRVTATTVVRTHNLLGRAYLAIILPFHRVIVRSMLRRVGPPGHADAGRASPAT